MEADLVLVTTRVVVKNGAVAVLVLGCGRTGLSNDSREWQSFADFGFERCETMQSRPIAHATDVEAARALTRQVWWLRSSRCSLQYLTVPLARVAER